LGQAGTEIFLQTALDSGLAKQPVGQISWAIRCRLRGAFRLVQEGRRDGSSRFELTQRAMLGFEHFEVNRKRKMCGEKTPNSIERFFPPSSWCRHQIVKPDGSHGACDSCESDEMEKHICSIAGPL
jgi:hypothetical protein